jgi:hypothetical protein
MRSPCCLCVYVLPTLLCLKDVAEEIAIAKKQLRKHATTTMNTTTTKELLELVFVSYSHDIYNNQCAV